MMRTRSADGSVSRRSTGLVRWIVAAVVAAVAGIVPPAHAQTGARPAGDAARGEYVFNAAGCLGCHTDVVTDGPRLAGGRGLKTPFGTFFSPNITPDPETGIGRWTEAQFAAAVRQGRTPDGES
jgi:cytochrome c2